mgnify:CR=1 FL=1
MLSKGISNVSCMGNIPRVPEDTVNDACTIRNTPVMLGCFQASSCMNILTTGWPVTLKSMMDPWTTFCQK